PVCGKAACNRRYRPCGPTRILRPGESSSTTRSPGRRPAGECSTPNSRSPLRLTKVTGARSANLPALLEPAPPPVRVDEFDVQSEAQVQERDQLVVERLARLGRRQQPGAVGGELRRGGGHVLRPEADVMEPASLAHERPQRRVGACRLNQLQGKRAGLAQEDD